MAQLFTNNAVSTMFSHAGTATTTLTLQAGTGSLFPAPSGGDFFLLTLTQAGLETSWEVVKVTARSGDTLTVVRAQEGTTAAEWVVGSRAELRVTAATLTAKQDVLVSGTSIKTINGASVLGSGDVVTGDVTLTGTQTLTNKTAEALALTNGYTEEVFAVSGTTPALSPTNGSIQTWALSGNSTPTAGTWAAGQSITLMVDDGAAYTITWTSLAVTWKTDQESAPTLNTTGYTVIQLWKVGTVIYGARVGNA